jgi:5,5'-dehydrodivanillate O-demethylase
MTTPVNPRSRAKERCGTKAYPVKECAGLLWTYMGPQPVPELPVWEPFTWENGFREVVLSDVPCNWFQCQENSCDPVHFEWMHDNWTLRLSGKTGPYASKHLKLKFEEFDYGFIYKRVREDSDERNPYWTVGRIALWPNGFYLGNHFEWRVPVDDENTLSVAWFFMRVPKGREPYVRTRSRPGSARSRTSTAAGSRATSSTRTSSPGWGRAASPTAPRRISAPATWASP